MDATLEILLSAYADGELDAAAAQALEARMASEPALQKQLAAYLRIDLAARAEKVPAMPAFKNLVQPFCKNAANGDGLTPAECRLQEAARAMPIPPVSDEKYDAAWKAIARHMRNRGAILDVMALDDGERDEPLAVPPEMNGLRRSWQILDKAASRIPSPEMSDEQTREAWGAIALETVAVPEQSGAEIDLMDDAAQSLPVPRVADARYDAVWKNISAALTSVGAGVNVQAADPVPQVDEKKWNTVWSEIQRQTTQAAPETKKVVHADFSAAARPSEKRGWRWGAVAALTLSAAAIALVMSLTPPTPGLSNTSLAMSEPEIIPAPVRVPEIVDNRYEVEVQYYENQTQPVICLFLKDEVATVEPAANFKWMPE